MRRSPAILRTALALAVFVLAAGLLAAQTPPDKFLGHKVGEDRKLADYTQIKAYFEKLAQETNRLKLFTIGESVLKRPIVMAAISTADNLAKLDRWKEVTRKLRDPRVTPVDEARRLAKEGKAIVLITCSLHATEIAASQMSMELAYDLVAGKTFFDAGKILSDVIVLLVPTSNPDGNQMVVDWYRKYVGTEFEGGSMPWLYHHYAGHDNNRDWYMFNLPETRAVTEVLYHDWLPQIHVDEHQQGSNGARLFVPPFMDPPLPNIQPSVWRGVNLVGTGMSYDLQKHGLSGVVNGRSYTAWWIGACDDTSWLHNVIGILSEAASVRVASPIYIEPNELQDGYHEKRMDFVDPWPGGWWRLRDLVDYELVLSKSMIKTAGLHKEDLLFNFYQMNKNSVESVDRGQPYAFVIPAVQRDYPTMLKMLEVLRMGGVEIHQAKGDFVAGGRFYSAGSFVVRMAQPYKTFAWALLERQKYPDMRQYPGGPPSPPYDNAAWTLPLQMGVLCDEVEDEVVLEGVDELVADDVVGLGQRGSVRQDDPALERLGDAAHPLAQHLGDDRGLLELGAAAVEDQRLAALELVVEHPGESGIPALGHDRGHLHCLLVLEIEVDVVVARLHDLEIELLVLDLVPPVPLGVEGGGGAGVEESRQAQGGEGSRQSGCPHGCPPSMGVLYGMGGKMGMSLPPGRSWAGSSHGSKLLSTPFRGYLSGMVGFCPERDKNERPQLTRGSRFG